MPRPGRHRVRAISTARRSGRSGVQAFNGLPVTGELDAATLALMSRPRCGFPDVSADFTAQGSKWNKTALTYAYSEFTADLTQAQVRTAISRAFSKWAAVTPLSFTEVAMGSSPDIVIRFVAGNHGDGNNFDGASGVLAHAYYPPPGGGNLAGDTHSTRPKPGPSTCRPRASISRAWRCTSSATPWGLRTPQSPARSWRPIMPVLTAISRPTTLPALGRSMAGAADGHRAAG